MICHEAYIIKHCTNDPFSHSAKINYNPLAQFSVYVSKARDYKYRKTIQDKPTRFKTTSLIHCEHYIWFCGQAAARQSAAVGCGVRLQHDNRLQFGARLQHGNQLQLVLGSGCSMAISCSSWVRLQHSNQLQLVWRPGCSTAISCDWFWDQAAARQSAVNGFGARLQHSNQLQFGARPQHCNLLQFGARLQHDKQLQLIWGPGRSTAIGCSWFGDRLQHCNQL